MYIDYGLLSFLAYPRILIYYEWMELDDFNEIFHNTHLKMTSHL